MKFSFHNRLTIKSQNKTFNFYNTTLKSLFQQLTDFKNYNSYISIGNGINNENSLNSFKLSNRLTTIPLHSKLIQSNMDKGELFAKYEFLVNTNNLHSEYLTEVGLSNNEDNPTIFNYFSLINDENPNGINISENQELSFEIIINLTIDEESICLTSGDNPFIQFLLGNGIDDVYICKGSNFSDNKRIERYIPNNENLILCNKNSTFNNETLEINFEGKINSGEIDEILFITNNTVFARYNTKEINKPIEKQFSTSAKANYVIKLDEDIKTINTITNSNNETEDGYFIEKYANSFGDKVNLPFYNLFNYQTSRFISKDGKIIFFVHNDKVYGYKNIDYSIIKLNTKDVTNECVTNIISFDNIVIITSQIEPYISTYIIKDNKLIKTQNNFETFEKYSDFSSIIQIDAIICHNDNILIGMILEDNTAMTLYVNYSEEFTIKSYISNTKEFSHILAMNRNNFCDGKMIYLKEGEQSILCRLVTHSADETETDIYTSLAYTLSNNATKIYCKGRALISEKTTEPHLVIYYYPQAYEYKLPLISSELKDYLSNDLYYLIQEDSNKNFKVYNLVGYDTPEEFTNNINEMLDTSTIQDFEFMKDTLLIFTNNKDEPIQAFNLKLNKTQIENISSKDETYNVNALVYNKIGSNNENINFNFTTRINLWFFQTKFTKY